MIPSNALDTCALISAERGKERALRCFDLAQSGRAKLWLPFPVAGAARAIRRRARATPGKCGLRRSKYGTLTYELVLLSLTEMAFVEVDSIDGGSMQSIPQS